MKLRFGTDVHPVEGYAVVTGATGAIGSQIALGLAERGYPLWLACRSRQKAEPLIEQCLTYGSPDVKFLPLELADEASVRAAAGVLSDFGSPLAGLINNAGIMQRHWQADSHGRELTMLVNYWHTRLFTELALPLIADGGAVVSTTSLTRFWPGRSDRLDVDAKHFSQLGTYGLSKKALTKWMRSMAHEPEGRRLRINCADPGIVSTPMISMHRWFDPMADLLFRPFIRSPRQGAIPALRAWSSPASGSIFCLRATHSL